MRISGWGSDVCSPALGALASVTTLIAHKSGGYITAVASCVPAKTDAQGIGSATTYLRRYSAAAAAGIAQEDDDGNAAAHTGKPKAVSRKSPVSGQSGSVSEGLGWSRLHKQTHKTTPNRKN